MCLGKEVQSMEFGPIWIFGQWRTQEERDRKKLGWFKRGPRMTGENKVQDNIFCKAYVSAPPALSSCLSLPPSCCEVSMKHVLLLFCALQLWCFCLGASLPWTESPENRSQNKPKPHSFVQVSIVPEVEKNTLPMLTDLMLFQL